MGIMVRFKLSTCSVSFSAAPSGNANRASVEMKIAPTPMGPNHPVNMASRNVLISGIHLYVARMIGIRLRRRTSRVRTTSLQALSFNLISNFRVQGIRGAYADGSIIKVAEWDQSPDVDERGTIEEQINNVRECRVGSGLVEEPVPGESGSTGERGEQIITSQQSRDT